MSDLLERILKGVVEGDATGIVGLAERALTEGHAADDLLNSSLMPAMDKVGALMESGEMFMPEVFLSARTMQAVLDVIKANSQREVRMVGKVAIGTVAGDLHTIGKDLVKMMLEGGGFEVVDLGHDVSPEEFVDVVQREKPDIVGMSALLTTTMQAMGHTLDALKEAGVRNRVKVLVGGAPVTQEFARQIGADGYSPNASAAVGLARELLGTD